MNKRLITAICVLGLAFSISQTAFAERPIKVLVGGEMLESDVAPITVNGRTMLPVRAVFEAIGAEVDYIEAEEKVVATKKGKTVSFVIGSNIMTINGEEKEIDVPAMIKNDRTLVPVRACAEAFDLDVEWNDKTHTVRVKKEVSVISESVDADGSWTKYTYDENGNEIYNEDSSRNWSKVEYDENGNKIYYSKGTAWSEFYWEKYIYDENGNKIYTEDLNHYWQKYTYDENGNVVYYEDWSGEIKVEYDENSNITYVEGQVFDPNSAEGEVIVWERNTYDENGNEFYYENSLGGWKKYTYDENGNKIYQENSSADWHKWVYDEDNNVIYHEESDGYWDKYTYNESGNKTYIENSNGEWEKYTYDENGNKTYFKNSDGKWEKYTYDENGNLTCIENSDGKIEKYIVVVR